MSRPDDVEACVKDLKKLYGLPPYDEASNYVRNDGYFARAIQRDYFPDTYIAARDRVNKMQEEWNTKRRQFAATH